MMHPTDTSRPKTHVSAKPPSVVHDSEPGVYSDGRGAHGLRLVVGSRAAGAVGKSWAQRLSVNGRPLNVLAGAG